MTSPSSYKILERVIGIPAVRGRETEPNYVVAEQAWASGATICPFLPCDRSLYFALSTLVFRLAPVCERKSDRAKLCRRAWLMVLASHHCKPRPETTLCLTAQRTAISGHSIWTSCSTVADFMSFLRYESEDQMHVVVSLGNALHVGSKF